MRKKNLKLHVPCSSLSLPVAPLCVPARGRQGRFCLPIPRASLLLMAMVRRTTGVAPGNRSRAVAGGAWAPTSSSGAYPAAPSPLSTSRPSVCSLGGFSKWSPMTLQRESRLRIFVFSFPGWTGGGGERERTRLLGLWILRKRKEHPLASHR